MKNQQLVIQTPEIFQNLLQPARYKGIYGGRGSGKSHFFSEMLIEHALINPGLRAVSIRQFQSTIEQSTKKILEQKIQKFQLQKFFSVRQDRIITPGDGNIIFMGMQDHNAHSIKSLENIHRVWVEEAQTLSQKSLNLLRPTIRAPESEIWFSWNPENKNDPVNHFMRYQKHNSAVCIHANFYHNPWFPNELEKERQFDQKNNPMQYPHIWLGQYKSAAQNPLWEPQDFIYSKKIQKCHNIVIAIDPAVCAKSKAAEHGIIVAGINEKNQAVIIDDLSCQGKPHIWAQIAIKAFEKYRARKIIVETNQGGDMVAHTLSIFRQHLPILEVRAHKPKHVRALPIALLYKKKHVIHRKQFHELEYQMLNMTQKGMDIKKSPDRLDAMVWALDHLWKIINRKNKQYHHTFKALDHFNPI